MRRNVLGSLIAGAALATAIAPAALAADDAKPATTIDASQGFVTFTSGDNSMTLGAWGQFRITGDDRDSYDSDLTGSGVGTSDGTVVSFAVIKIRPYLQGTVYKPWLKYRFEFELGPLGTSATNDINNSRLTDAYVEFAKIPAATLRVGQYKVPFGLQELTADWRQEFVDRSIADAKFAPSRDIGLMLYGLAWERKFGYQVAVFNGAGQNNPQEDKGVMGAARVWIDPLGEYKLSEGAVDNPEHHIVHVGLAYRTGEVDKGTATPGVFEHPNNETAADLEIAWKWRRLFAMGEYFAQKNELKNPTSGPDVEAWGWHAQFGVFVVPKQHELALRYAVVEPDKDVADAQQTEARLVYGYFIKGHNLKLQADVGEVKFGANFAALPLLALRNVTPSLDQLRRLVPLPGTALTDKQARVQLTVSF